MENIKLTYFIRSKDFVKIGSSADPIGRLKELQTANQEPLELMCTTSIPEKEIQDKFKLYHKQGEWYFLSNEIKKFIDQIILENQKNTQVSHEHPKHVPGSNDLLEIIKIITEMDCNKKGKPKTRAKQIFRNLSANESPREIKKRHSRGSFTLNEILKQMKTKGLNYSPRGLEKLLEDVFITIFEGVILFPGKPLEFLKHNLNT